MVTRMRRVASATGLVAVLAVGSTACSSSDDSSEPEETTTTTAAVVNTGGAVEVFDFEYLPATIVIEAGQSITWTNTSDNRHTVTSQDDRFVSSSTIQGDQAFVQAFSEPGTYPYFCTFHPDKMLGTITVE